MKRILWTIPAIILGLQFTDVALADVVPAGTEITVRTDSGIDSRNADGRIYTGVVDRDVLDRDGRVVIQRGSPVEMIARRWGQGELSLDMESIVANGRRYEVDASPEEFNGNGRRDGVGKNERTAKYVGGGAVIGSIIGAIAGGGKGAAIGAAAGAASGAGAQYATRGREVHIPSESLLTFRLDRSIHVVDSGDPGYNRDGYHYHRYRDYDRP